MSYPYLSNEEFRERIKAILNIPRVKGPCVRTPTDRGYYPPDKTRDAQARAQCADIAYDLSEVGGA